MVSRLQQHGTPVPTTGAMGTMPPWHRHADRRSPWAGIVCAIAPFVNSAGIDDPAKLTSEERAP